jgi:hypothetical protein
MKGENEGNNELGGFTNEMRENSQKMRIHHQKEIASRELGNSPPNIISPLDKLMH